MIKESVYNMSNINFDSYYKDANLPISNTLKKMLDEASRQATDSRVKKNTLKEILSTFRSKHV